jgi:hypothetical protein
MGDRRAESRRKLWQRIAYEYRQAGSYSDFWYAYEQLLTTGKHQLVGKESGQTAHGERWNCTLRQRLARYVRKTLSFLPQNPVTTGFFVFLAEYSIPAANLRFLYAKIYDLYTLIGYDRPQRHITFPLRKTDYPLEIVSKLS